MIRGRWLSAEVQPEGLRPSISSSSREEGQKSRKGGEENLRGGGLLWFMVSIHLGRKGVTHVPG